MKKFTLFSIVFLLCTLVANAQYNSIVAKDGTGNHTTVQAAIDAAPINSATPYVILIKNGKYYEKVTVPSNKPNIQLIGENVANVMVYYDDYAGKPVTGGGTLGTQNSASVTINAADFVAINITFANTLNYDSAAAAGITGLQAVAVVINADRVAFKNCRFIGMQDTLYTKGSGNPRHYFYKCYIDGIVDFIFGSSIAIFDSCVIYPKSRTGTGSSYITAANTTTGQLYGYWFKDCIIPANTGATLYYLGRPWNNATSGVTAANKTVYTNTAMSNSVNPLGWSVWDAGTNTSVITYAEYKSKKFDGSLVDVSNRVAWSKQFTDADTVGYNILNVLNGWNPCSVRADFCTSPNTEIAIANFKGTKNGANTNFSWNIAWAVSGISYELYRSVDNKISYQLLSTTTATNDSSINFSGTDAVPPSCSSYFYFVKASKAGYATHYTDTIEVSSTPTITTTTNSLTNFLQGSTAPSGSQNFVVNGVNLLNNITLTAPANFEISTDNSTWVNSSSSITLTQTSGSVSNTIIYVRLNAASPGNYSGDLTFTTTCSATTITKLVAVSGTTQSTPLFIYNVIQQWDLTADNSDNASARALGVVATTPRFNRLYSSNGTQVPAIAAYSTQFGQAFGATANGDGSWGTGSGGPGGNLNRTYFEEFTIKPYFDATTSTYIRVDSILLTTAFYNTSSGVKMAVVYSKSNFTVDSANVTGGRDGSGLTLSSGANGAFTTPIALSNQTSGPTAVYALALNAGNGVQLYSNTNGLFDSLKVRLYYACGSSSAGRYAMLKNVQIKGESAQTLPLKFVTYAVNRNAVTNEVESKWTTANEVNVSHYNIQRSTNNKDFITVGTVNARNKNSNEYYYSDKLTRNKKQETLYYRIESVDRDGQKTYSTVQQINIKLQTSNNVLVYPNPAKDYLNISSLVKTQASISNVSGSVVKSVLLKEGINSIDIQQLAAGIYYITVDGKTERIVIEK